MKKSNFKEFWKNYKEWCDEGKKKGYGNMLMIILLPLLILLCACYFFIGKATTEQKYAIKELNRTLDAVAENPETK